MRAVLLILRPQPGADETAAAAEARGLETLVAPLFDVRPVEWRLQSDDDLEAVMVTSANALRHGGCQTSALLAKPCYAVGERTAAEARAAGFHDVRTGSSDGRALVEMMEKDGVGSALHLCGADHIQLRSERVLIRPVPVYRSIVRDALPREALRCLAGGSSLALIHSPRAGTHFAGLCDEARVDRGQVGLAAISSAAMEAAGTGWRIAAHAPNPRDEALLELAAKLCEAGEAAGRI